MYALFACRVSSCVQIRILKYHILMLREQVNTQGNRRMHSNLRVCVCVVDVIDVDGIKSTEKKKNKHFISPTFIANLTE